MRKDKYQKVITAAQAFDSSFFYDEEDEVEVDIVEWTWSKKLISCPGEGY